MTPAGPVDPSTKVPCSFTYDHYREIIRLAKERYDVIPLSEYRSLRSDTVFLLRHDVDLSPGRAERMAGIEHDLNVKSTYFVRVHAEAYNPFSFKTYVALRRILEMGHEIGLHFESLDVSHISGENPLAILKKEILVLQTILGIKIEGIAAHGDFSGIDNSDLAKSIDLAEYGLEYEASALTKDCLFVSDSLRRWSRTNDRCICQVLEESPPRVCLLTHPEYWYSRAYHLE